MSDKNKRLCRICGNEYAGEGYNAWPLSKSLCCDKCYSEIVLTARLNYNKTEGIAFDRETWLSSMDRAWAWIAQGEPIVDAIYQCLPIDGYEERAGIPFDLHLNYKTVVDGKLVQCVAGRLVHWGEINVISRLTGGMEARLRYCGTLVDDKDNFYRVFRLGDTGDFYFIKC